MGINLDELERVFSDPVFKKASREVGSHLIFLGSLLLEGNPEKIKAAIVGTDDVANILRDSLTGLSYASDVAKARKAIDVAEDILNSFVRVALTVMKGML